MQLPYCCWWNSIWNSYNFIVAVRCLVDIKRELAGWQQLFARKALKTYIILHGSCVQWTRDTLTIASVDWLKCVSNILWASDRRCDSDSSNAAPVPFRPAGFDGGTKSFTVQGWPSEVDESFMLVRFRTGQTVNLQFVDCLNRSTIPCAAAMTKSPCAGRINWRLLWGRCLKTIQYFKPPAAVDGMKRR